MHPSHIPGSFEKQVAPHEVRKLPTLPDLPATNDGLRALTIASVGAVYPGPEIEAIISAVKVLRHRPDLAKVLLGTDSTPSTQDEVATWQRKHDTKAGSPWRECDEREATRYPLSGYVYRALYARPQPVSSDAARALPAEWRAAADKLDGEGDYQAAKVPRHYAEQLEAALRSQTIRPETAHRYVAAYDAFMGAELEPGTDHSIVEFDAVLAGLTAVLGDASTPT